MVTSLLQRWQSANKVFPEVILYYRDGVSDGQFGPVLKRELNELYAAFSSVQTDYNPELVIIVGQKRHHTRFACEDATGDQGSSKGKGKDDKGSKGKGKSDKGKAKGGGIDPAQVEPGTVAGEGVALPGHLNFFLVAHQGIKGTSVPCHYHVLHLDPALRLGADDIERVTYDLCH